MGDGAIAVPGCSGSGQFKVTQSHREIGGARFADPCEKTFVIASTAAIGVVEVHIHSFFSRFVGSSVTDSRVPLRPSIES
jgi:hypothetical protein